MNKPESHDGLNLVSVLLGLREPWRIEKSILRRDLSAEDDGVVIRTTHAVEFIEYWGPPPASIHHMPPGWIYRGEVPSAHASTDEG